MKYFRLLTIIFLALFGCQSDSTISTDHIVISTLTPIAPPANNRLVINSPDFTISVPHPPHWDYYQLDAGLAMVEQTVSMNNLFDGIVFHIWINPPQDLELGDFQSPQTILEQIIINPVYIGTASVTHPQPFDWNGIEASYYIFDNHLGRISIVIGLMLPEHPHLIAINISAPIDQVDNLRQQVPVLLDHLIIDGITTSGAIIDQILPESLMISPRPVGGS